MTPTSIYCGPCDNEQMVNNRTEATNQLSTRRTRRRSNVNTNQRVSPSLPSPISPPIQPQEPTEINNDDISCSCFYVKKIYILLVVLLHCVILYAFYFYTVYTNEKLQETSEKIKLMAHEMGAISREQLYHNHWRQHEVTKNGVLSLNSDDDYDDNDDNNNENDHRNNKMMIERVVKKQTEQLKIELIKLKKELNLLQTHQNTNGSLKKTTQSFDRIDYAMDKLGGSIENVGENTKLVGNIYRFLMQLETYAPKKLIQTTMEPGDCFAFYGQSGEVIIRLARPIIVDAFSIIHINREQSPNGKIDSAPKVFTVSGLYENDNNNIDNKTPTSTEHLFGTYEYSIDFNAEELQMFPIENYRLLQTGFRLIRFNFLSNHGNEDYTCIYRVRVHGKPFK